MKNKKLVVMVGPTAVGKTALAILLAEKWGTEIISADSRQVFKEMEIGTAKPTVEELRRVPHHFINTKSITDSYNAQQFGIEAMRLIEFLFEKLNIVIVCGGSGLYIKSLLEGFDQMPEISAELRQEIVSEYEWKGLSWLQQELNRIDPEYYQSIDQKNPHRLIRGLEINRASQKNVNEFRKGEKIKLPFEVVKIGIELSREELYTRIDNRMDNMITNGLFEEASKLYSYRDMHALQTVGYQEIFNFMEGKYDRIETIRLLKRNSRRYAKRQLTWFKKDQEIKWYKPDQLKGMMAL